MRNLGFLLVAISSLSIAQTWTQSQMLTHSDPDQNDRFGSNIDGAGDYVVVTSTGEDFDELGENQADQAGAAYVLKKDAFGDWQEVQKLVAPDREASDYFGSAVAMTDGWILVGAESEDHDLDGLNELSSAGSAYVYEKTGPDTWGNPQKLVPSDRASASSYFGNSVAIMDSVLFVASYYRHKVYVFELGTNGLWTETQILTSSDASSNRFGERISCDGNVLAIGAYDESLDADGLNSVTGAGAVYMFGRQANGLWVETQKISAVHRTSRAYFGAKTFVKDGFLFVGSASEDLDENGLNELRGAGAVYVYEFNASTEMWDFMQKIVAPIRYEYDSFGTFLDFDGETLAISNDGMEGYFTYFPKGQVLLYQLNGGNVWTLQETINPVNPDEDEQFGYAISFTSGDLLVTGSDRDSIVSDVGVLYVYKAPVTTYLSDDVNQLDGALFYPNPVGELRIIQFEEVQELIQIVDVQGRTIRTFEGVREANLAYLKSGNYWVKSDEGISALILD